MADEKFRGVKDELTVAHLRESLTTAHLQKTLTNAHYRNPFEQGSAQGNSNNSATTTPNNQPEPDAKK